MLKKKMHGKPLVYLDTAATSQKPQILIDTIANFYTNHYATVHRTIYELSTYATAEYERTREKVRQFLNAAHVEEIIFTKGATDAINLVAHSFGKAFIKPGDQIIISEMEHHSNIVPWQMLCQATGAVLKVIPIGDNATLNIDEYEKLLCAKTKLVSISHIANSTGTLNPIETIIKMAHQVNAKVVIDGAQAAPHIAIDVQRLDADFYLFSGHKMYGPTGIGILYGKKELLEQMPPYQGGGDMIETVTMEKTTYNQLPLKFEAGTPQIAEVIGLGSAIDYLLSIGLSTIHEWEEGLMTHATALIRNIPGVQLMSNAAKKGAIVTFTVDNLHPLDIGTLLDLQGIAIRTGHLCAQPTMKHFGITAACRASFGLYNTKEEVEFFADALRKVIQKLT